MWWVTCTCYTNEMDDLNSISITNPNTYSNNNKTFNTETNDAIMKSTT